MPPMNKDTRHMGVHHQKIVKYVLLSVLGSIFVALKLRESLSFSSHHQLHSPVRTLEKYSNTQSIRAATNNTLTLMATPLWKTADLPIVPSEQNQTTQQPDEITATAYQAIQDFFQKYTTEGGWIDLGALDNADGDNHITGLRSLATDIMMGREMNCGKPKVMGKQVLSGNSTGTSAGSRTSEYEYCFWKDDVVSNKAMEDFSWEPQLWKWVVESYRDLQQFLPESLVPECQLAFLDLGTNVGDWASPIIVELPNTPYLAIEGTPSTGAMAAANMLTSMSMQRIRQTQRKNENENNQPTATFTALLPYALLPWNKLKETRNRGHVCFGENAINIGGQSVDSLKDECAPKVTAGATYLPHALHSIASKQDACPGRNDWPRVYITKIDIQGMEFKALSSAYEWFNHRPPCYIIIEANPHDLQMPALTELLLDIGYDALWRTVDPYPHRAPNRSTSGIKEFPPGSPYWSRLLNQTTLHDAIDQDLNPRESWMYKDYIFGFQDTKACILRLLE